MNTPLKVLTTILLTFGSSLFAANDRPNVVWLFAEDTSPWMGDLRACGRSLKRAVDLSTMPIYVRAGAIIPVDPIRQYTEQKPEEPTTLKICQGTDGDYLLYDDDGISLGYLKGESVQTRIRWHDKARRLILEPQVGQGTDRTFRIELLPSGKTKEIRYRGKRIEVVLK